MVGNGHGHWGEVFSPKTLKTPCAIFLDRINTQRLTYKKGVIMRVRLPKKLECLKCGHKWTPRQIEVRICPKCKTAYFDKPRKES